jgi:nucleotide-binding universal stress UspA family protein
LFFYIIQSSFKGRIHGIGIISAGFDKWLKTPQLRLKFLLLVNDSYPDMSILIAYDGKADTEAALDYATKLSVGLNEPLYILTVATKEQMDPEDIDPTIQEYMQAAQQKAMQGGLCDVHTIIEVGRPDDVILEVAERFQCDAIVVGRPDRSRLDRMVMGSVSQKLVENSECPVVIVPTPDEEE